MKLLETKKWLYSFSRVQTNHSNCWSCFRFRFLAPANTAFGHSLVAAKLRYGNEQDDVQATL